MNAANVILSGAFGNARVGRVECAEIQQFYDPTVLITHPAVALPFTSMKDITLPFGYICNNTYIPNYCLVRKCILLLFG